VTCLEEASVKNTVRVDDHKADAPLEDIRLVYLPVSLVVLSWALGAVACRIVSLHTSMCTHFSFCRACSSLMRRL
jgi:hypothetical protein